MLFYLATICVFLAVHVTGQLPGIGTSSTNNVNPPPPQPIYPKTPSDAPYSVPEARLRAAIYIPRAYGYGRNGKEPVLLVPGTGAYGGNNYESNLIKLLSRSDFADPVWLNIPGAQLNDAQQNAEFAAYAINYLSSVSQNQNISVVGWSQGTLSIQWALKYWESTRDIVDDFVALSADFHGTVNAYVICTAPPCPPAVNQQEYDSNFINTIRSNGGDSAYVPTTTVYSIFDEIVQPQAGTIASAFLKDERQVGVTNNELQSICPAQPGGGPYPHEGTLYNSIAYALLRDAIINNGPGQVSRLNLATLCQQTQAQGLTPADVTATEAIIALAGANIVLYPGKSTAEPPIRAYATVP